MSGKCLHRFVDFHFHFADFFLFFARSVYFADKNGSKT